MRRGGVLDAQASDPLQQDQPRTGSHDAPPFGSEPLGRRLGCRDRHGQAKDRRRQQGECQHGGIPQAEDDQGGGDESKGVNDASVGKAGCGPNANKRIQEKNSRADPMIDLGGGIAVVLFLPDQPAQSAGQSVDHPKGGLGIGVLPCHRHRKQCAEEDGGKDGCRPIEAVDLPKGKRRRYQEQGKDKSKPRKRPFHGALGKVGVKAGGQSPVASEEEGQKGNGVYGNHRGKVGAVQIHTVERHREQIQHETQAE